MSAPTVYIFHRDSKFIEQMSHRLGAYGISVSAKFHLSEFEEAMKENAAATCALINLTFDNFQMFKKTVLKKRSATEKTPLALLVHDDNLFRFVERNSGENVHIFNSNILLENLVYEILNLIPTPVMTDIFDTHVNTAYGKFSETSFSTLLNFVTRSAFSGVLGVYHQSEQGLIRFAKGRIVQASFRNLRRREALRAIASLEDASFRLEQKIYTIDDISKLASEDYSEVGVSPTDVLIDLFYFMHTYLEQFLPLESIQSVVEDVIEHSGDVDLYDVVLIYDQNLQEKLRILGEVKPHQISAVLTVFEKIYDEFKDQLEFKSFSSYIDTLEELSPYLKQLQTVAPARQNRPEMIAD